ncbi:MAG TPA: alpha-galactosidase [Candidatus Lachnoclostridium stercorigallinarum]|uniref:Alpha-galactosidase n=1 Tax=Candidatus Lachnoclostridium stercorigallinarum TaxID=2838634 RepID=A0A9D2GHI5_9FIRM|nr:alpha-galactosidase [Candidatus Lachnoclostridium stercorigallinarum]
MAIRYNADTKTFILETKNSSYLMKVSRYGNLLHLYYGGRVPDEDLDYLIIPADRGFSPNPNEAGNDRTFSLDSLPQEFSTSRSGDYRSSSMEIVWGRGASSWSGKVAGYEIYPGAPKIKGMPGLRALPGEEAETLVIRLEDPVSGFEAELSYGVFEEKDVIARSVMVINRGEEAARLERVMSATLDFMESDYDLIYFSGRHLMERGFRRIPVSDGIHAIGSSRGASSHQYNPFAIVCEKNCTEDYGQCWGVSLVYSGCFLMEAEKDQFGQMRVNAGINPRGFSFQLEPGAAFQAPQTVLTWSGKGLTELSHIYHRIFRENLCRSPYRKNTRPVLLNSWEAAYFDFDGEKILSIAKEAVDMGVDLFVLDDGWFGCRDNDDAALGDWTENRKKLGMGLCELSEKIHAMGLEFGIWVEPEMVSEESELYRRHPDWCLREPGRPPVRGRYQLVLDLSRRDVCDYIIDAMNSVLDKARIEYVKWDMNRSITEAWSALLDRNRQGEVLHRYILGLYYVMDQVILRHPDVLFCGCGGGGGRFDPAMLYYQPQIWCSDNTDAVNRLKIQYGTSFAYPVSSMEAHVSVCPNHQTGRTTPLNTRGIVAMDGIFGYELDPTKMTGEEKEECREQIRFYKKHYRLITEGDYYRLTSPYENRYLTAWQQVSQDRKKSLVSIVITDKEGNDAQRYVKLKGLDPDGFYRIEGWKGKYSGKLLMNVGIPVPGGLSEYEGIQLLLKMA